MPQVDKTMRRLNQTAAMQRRVDNAHMLSQYAINTGELYKLHCELARAKAPTFMWREYVRAMVLPRYQREFHDSSVADATTDLNALGELLRDYYTQHVNE